MEAEPPGLNYRASSVIKLRPGCGSRATGLNYRASSVIKLRPGCGSRATGLNYRASSVIKLRPGCGGHELTEGTQSDSPFCVPNFQMYVCWHILGKTARLSRKKHFTRTWSSACHVASNAVECYCDSRHDLADVPAECQDGPGSEIIPSLK